MMDRSNFKYHIPCLVAYQKDGEMQTYLIINGKYYNKAQFVDSDEIFYIIEQFPVTTVNYDLTQTDEGYEGTFYCNSNMILYGQDGSDDCVTLTCQDNYKDHLVIESYQKKVEILQNEYDKLQNELTTVKNNFGAQSEKIDTLSNENESLKNNIEQLNQQLERYQEFSKVAYIKPRCSNYLFIDIFRISSDGKYLEIDVSCDDAYGFESIFIKEYSSDRIFDISEYIEKDSTRQMFRVNLDSLNGPSMYYANISIKLKNGAYYDIIDSEQRVEIAASDISNVYFYILKELLCVSNYDPCGNKLSTELQRIFVLMFAHLEAMRLERWKEAEMFYTVIKNNFSNCKSNLELKPNKTCCCNGQIR